MNTKKINKTQENAEKEKSTNKRNIKLMEKNYHNAMANSSLSRIILNVNELNLPIKRQGVIECIF